MTETYDTSRINGHMVITREPAVQPGNPVTNGSPSVINGVERVLLDDESTVHQCTTCGWTSNEVMSVRSHRAIHTKRRRDELAELREQIGRLSQLVSSNGHALDVTATLPQPQGKPQVSTEPTRPDEYSDTDARGRQTRASLSDRRSALLSGGSHRYLVELARQIEELYRVHAPVLRAVAREIREQGTGESVTPGELAQLRADQRRLRRILGAVE